MIDDRRRREEAHLRQRELRIRRQEAADRKRKGSH